MPTDNKQKLPGSLKEISRALTRGVEGHLKNYNSEEKHEWLTRLLATFDYNNLSREDKGIVRQYILQETGYSRAQSTRLIHCALETILEHGADKILGIETSEKINLSYRIRNYAKNIWDHKKEIIKHPAFRTWSIGLGSTAFCLTAIASVINTTPDPLQFLNASVGSNWSIIDAKSEKNSAFDLRKTAFGQPVSIVTAVTSLDATTGKTAPLFYQTENVNLYGNIESNSVLTASATLSSLISNVAKRQESRLAALVPATLRTWIYSREYDPSFTGSFLGSKVSENLSGKRIISLSGATIPQIINGNVISTAKTYEQYSYEVSSILQRVDERRAQRLASLGYDANHASAPNEPNNNLVSFNGDISAFLGKGREGEVLMIVNGIPQWKHIVQSEVGEDPTHGEYISRRGGGSGQGGGSAGTPGSTGTEGPQGPAGPTMGIFSSLQRASQKSTNVWLDPGDAGELSLYNLGRLSVGTSATDSVLTVSGSTVLGTLASGTVAKAGLALEVIGSMSGASLSVSDLHSCTIITTNADGTMSCGSIGSIVIAAVDNRYVNTAGDTMTGALIVQNNLDVTGTMSGRLLYISGDGARPALVTLASGYVGIGTSSPTTALEVVGTMSGSQIDITNDSTAQLRLIKNGNIATIRNSNSLYIESPAYTAGVGALYIYGHNNSEIGTDRGKLKIYASQVGQVTAYIHFDTSGSERMRISNGGLVGIGTESPTTKLEVVGTISGSIVNVSDTIGLQTTTSSTRGVIYKGAYRFIHDFHHPVGGGAVPDGNNIFVGIEAGNFTMGETATNSTNASYNVGIGYRSLYSNTLGDRNMAMGYQSLYFNTTGRFNTAIGMYSLRYNTTGNYNIGLAYGALYSNKTGSNGVAIGESSQYYANDTVTPWTNQNTSVGYQSLRGSATAANNTGNANTALGYQTLYGNSTGGSNTAIGYWALNANTTGSNNTANGVYALYSNTTGSNNTANGMYALYSNKTGSNGVAIGYNSQLYVNDTAVAWTNYNTSVGYQSLMGSATAANNTGNSNTALGYQALLANTSGNYNIANGASALATNTTGERNAAIGYASLYSNTSGGYNIAIGMNNLYSNTSGGYNIAIGMNNLYSNKTGSNGVAIGYNSQYYANDTAVAWTNYNTSVGYQSLRGSTTAANNTGNSNTALGYQTLYANTSGMSNTAIGLTALYGNITGVSNTALGASAGRYITGGVTVNTTSDYSVYLGASTKASADDAQNEIVIGYNAVGAGSNSVVLGADTITKTLLRGSVGIGTGANLYAKQTIYTTDAFNNEALLINTDETTGSQNVFKIISDVAGGNDVAFRITADGSTYSDNAYASTGADYAEYFRTSYEQSAVSYELQPGEVVCIDVTQANTVKRCDRNADANVMGIVSTNPAFIGNNLGGAERLGIDIPGYALIGLIGQVPAKVMIEATPSEDSPSPLGGGLGRGQSGSTLLTIRPGDALTSASVPGYARKAMPGEPTVGVALESFDGAVGETSTVNVLISRRNSSLTVDQVESKVLDQIAAMQIEDEIEIMIASAFAEIDLEREVGQEFAALVKELKIETTLEKMRLDVESYKLHVESQLSLSGSTLSGSSLADAVTNMSDQILYLEETIANMSGALMEIAHSSLFDATQSGQLTANSFSTEELHTAAFTASGTTVINGTLIINGKEFDAEAFSNFNLQISNFGSGTTLDIGDLTLPNALLVLGDITIEGLAKFMSNVIIRKDLTVFGTLTASGTLIVNKDQAGIAIVPMHGTGVVITFETPYDLSQGHPIITASSSSFEPWRLVAQTQNGFTIELADPAPEDITFTWHALAVKNPKAVYGTVNGIQMVEFPVDERGVPISSSEIWNSCIRQQAPLDITGKPFNCSRYHEKDIWFHPDLMVEFVWDSEAQVRLILPDGYKIVSVKQNEDNEINEDNENNETGTGSTITDPPSTETGSTTVIDPPATETGSTTVIDPPATETGSTTVTDPPSTETGSTTVTDPPATETEPTAEDDTTDNAITDADTTEDSTDETNAGASLSGENAPPEM